MTVNETGSLSVRTVVSINVLARVLVRALFLSRGLDPETADASAPLHFPDFKGARCFYRSAHKSAIEVFIVSTNDIRKSYGQPDVVLRMGDIRVARGLVRLINLAFEECAQSHGEGKPLTIDEVDDYIKRLRDAQ